MEQFQERLARLAELSDEELQALEDELVAAFDAADQSADLENMQAYADALDQVRSEKAGRSTPDETAADTAPPEAAPAPPVAASVDTAPSPEVTEAPAPVAETPTPEATPEPAAPAAPAATPAAPAASDDEVPEGVEQETPADPESEDEEATTPETSDETPQESEESVTTITADEVPEENRPVQAAAPHITIRAGGDIPGYTAGTELNDFEDIVDAMTRKVNAMRNIGGDGEHLIVASMRVEDEPAEERVLRPGDLNGNAEKIRKLLGDKDALRPEALTAAAWCAPRAPIYDVPTVGTTRRPVKDSLPSFNADRGGVTWMAPPGLPDIAGAAGLWRHNGSAWNAYTDPQGTTTNDPATDKPYLHVPCGNEHSADVDAITMSLCFDNTMSRAFPEWIRANTELTMIAQARFAEQVLLSRMYALAATGGHCTTVNTSVGVARDFFLTVRTAAAAARWRNRIDEDSPLQLLAPAWVATAMAVDLGLQAPGDDTLATSVSEVVGYFREAYVDPIFHIDDVPGHTSFTGCAYPATVRWMLYPTGSFMRLDTGELNLGVIRTKEDVLQNKYCEFSETFETVAYMGPEAPNGWVTVGNTDVNIYGSAAALTDTTA